MHSYYMSIDLDYLQFTLRGQHYSFYTPKGVAADCAYKGRIRGVVAHMKSAMIGMNFAI